MVVKTAPIVVKVPVEEKKYFTELTKELGTTPSDAIRLFIRAFEKEKGFPFTPKLKKVPKYLKPDLSKIPTIPIDPKYGHAILPKEWDYPEDAIYDELYGDLLND